MKKMKKNEKKEEEKNDEKNEKSLWVIKTYAVSIYLFFKYFFHFFLILRSSFSVRTDNYECIYK